MLRGWRPATIARMIIEASQHPGYLSNTYLVCDHAGGEAVVIEGQLELGTAYGHIAISAHDLDATLEALAEHGIEPERPPYTIREGGNRICFVRDPDGYRVELVEHRPEGMINDPGEGQSST